MTTVAWGLFAVGVSLIHVIGMLGLAYSFHVGNGRQKLIEEVTLRWIRDRENVDLEFEIGAVPVRSEDPFEIGGLAVVGMAASVLLWLVVTGPDRGLDEPVVQTISLLVFVAVLGVEATLILGALCLAAVKLVRGRPEVSIMSVSFALLAAILMMATSAVLVWDAGGGA